MPNIAFAEKCYNNANVKDSGGITFRGDISHQQGQVQMDEEYSGKIQIRNHSCCKVILEKGIGGKS